MKVFKKTSLAAATALLLAQTAEAVTTTTVIVEFEGDPAAVQMARAENGGSPWSDDQIENYRADLAFAQDNVLADMRAAGIDFHVGNVNIPDYTGLPAGNIEYRYTMVLNGAAIEVPIDQIGALRQVNGVKNIYRSEIHRPMLDNSVRYINAPAMYGGDHALGPFDNLLEGFEGQGINMSVLDTGVEHHHEMFGGDPTPPRLALAPHSAAIPTNEKVIYSMPTADPFLEDGFGHGTHVATTAVGYLGYTLEGIPLHGVAPQAKLMTYGVCQTVLSTVSAVGVPNPLGGCRGETILLGLEDSVSRRTVTGFAKPVAHVLNMSLGSPSGSPTSATAVAASNAALAGTIVVAAAGNSGNNRSVVGSPSTGTHVISVAASTDPGVAGLEVDIPGDRQDITVQQMSGTPAPAGNGINSEYVYVASSASPTGFPSEVNGKIAFVASHSGAFASAIAGAEAAGAIGLILRRDDGANGVTGNIPAVTMRLSDFDYMAGLLPGGASNGSTSNVAIRLGGAFERGNITGFSSRGPVSGFGQVKPDVSAPGENILAALPPASVLGALEATNYGPSYGDISGTSMASPHVAGAAALIKQANPTWGPAEVRTALLNTATQMRDLAGNPDSYGTHNPTINSQGGGLVDVEAAAFAQAMMGVVGDGINAPRILGSHAFGNEPVLGSECSNTNTSVTVELRDLRGTGGTYNLSVAGDGQLTYNGTQSVLTSTSDAQPFVSAGQVTVSPNGTATFETGLGVDGTQFSGAAEFQWYVVAERDDGTETLSMPIFFRAVPTVPAGGGDVIVTTEIHDGNIDAGATQADAGTEVDVPVEVPAGVFRLVANLDGDVITSESFPDYDLELYDPNGQLIGSSGNGGSVEFIDVTISQPGTYTYVVENYLGGPGSYTLTVDMHSVETAAEPATMNDIAIEFDADIDGNYLVSWNPVGGELAFVLEERVNGGAWNEVASLSPSTSSFAVANASNGTYEYRVSSHFPGQVCTYVTDPSNVASVVVHKREAVTVTSGIQISGASGGADLDYLLTFLNQSGVELYEPIVLTVEPSAGYSVENADVGSNGFNLDDEVDGNSWASGEETSPVQVNFSGPNSPFFTVTVQASGYAAVE